MKPVNTNNPVYNRNIKIPKLTKINEFMIVAIVSRSLTREANPPNLRPRFFHRCG